MQKITTIEVENMGATALYEDQKKVIEAIRDEPDLPERYVQARLDALTRDVKLAEQAETLSDYKIGLDAAKRDAEAAREEAVQSRKELVRADALADGLNSDLTTQKAAAIEAVQKMALLADEKAARDAETISGLRVEVAEEKRRSDRMKAQAVRAITALTSVKVDAQCALTTVVASVAETLTLEELEAADKGE